MVASFANSNHGRLFDSVLVELGRLGYTGELLQTEYRFEHWFASRTGVESKIVSLDAVAFGRLPLADDNACFGIEATGGIGPALATEALLSRCRSLCAPVAIQVTPEFVQFWPVRADATFPVQSTPIAPDRVRAFFDDHSAELKPAELLRAKNIRPVRPRQTDFIDVGLMPAYEEQLREKLDPLLRSTLFKALKAYKRRYPNISEAGFQRLFRLVFRVLAGKMLTDRNHHTFSHFVSDPIPDALLDAVNKHFGDDPQLIGDLATRQAVVDSLWEAFSLRHISASVLSLVWENTLVDPEVRKAIGLYGTPPAVAQFIVDRLRLEDLAEGDRTLIEPCCGSGVFLLAGLRQLTELLDTRAYSPSKRHGYLKRMLSGFDIEPFGVEVARDCLMLADYPNSNGWVVREANVFELPDHVPEYYSRLRTARSVVCNPPFKPKLSHKEMERFGAKHAAKPAEVLSRVLANTPLLHSLGFVMPHQLLAGKGYKLIRGQLAQRFQSLEVSSLPKSGVFSRVNYEVVILIASQPRSKGDLVTLTHRRFSDDAWSQYIHKGAIPDSDSTTRTIAAASRSISVPVLGEVWDSLRDYETLSSVTERRKRRGIQWNKSLEHYRNELIIDTWQEGYKLGIPSAEEGLYAYLSPPTKFLSVKKKDQYRKAFNLPWDRPKVVMNTNRRGGGHPWQIAAFPERHGAVCPDTYKAYWPKGEWSPELLAAVLNGPVANAFVSSRSSGRQLLNRDVDKIPVPRFSQAIKIRVESLVNQYIEEVHKRRFSVPSAEQLLLQIDASILSGYDLSPRLERKLLDYFNGYGSKRPVGFSVSDYYPQDFTSTIPLHMYLSSEYRKSTAENLLRAIPVITDPDLVEALEEVG